MLTLAFNFTPQEIYLRKSIHIVMGEKKLYKQPDVMNQTFLEELGKIIKAK